METLFYVAGAVAVLSTLMMLTRLYAVHALLYLIVSLLSVALIFFEIGAPFVAALEVIIYAGAIMVLFIFVVMMLNLGKAAAETERTLLKPGMWWGPGALSAILLAELAYALSQAGPAQHGSPVIAPKEVGMALFGPYLIGAELASILLLGGMVGAYHLGRQTLHEPEIPNDVDSNASRAATGGDLVHAGTDRPDRAP